MNRIYSMNNNIQTSVWEGGVFKYSIILNTNKINLKDKLTNISTFKVLVLVSFLLFKKKEV